MLKLNPLDYRIALFAVLEIEAQAALHMLDHRHDGEFSLDRGDDYVFHAGDINGRNVIIATFPAGQNYGTGSAASLASQTKSYFRNLWFGLLVGVAAGLPNHGKTPPIDIRLGDVLVALPKGDSAGLISYDLGKTTDDGFQLLDGGRVLAKTEPVIRSAIGAIKINAPNDSRLFLPFYAAMKDEEHSFEFSRDETFRDPGQDEDKLYSIGTDGFEYEVPRLKRPDSKRTRVWYGPIGSGDKLMKNSQERDRLRDSYNIVGLEMEAAGVLSSLPVGVIRGVCDYGDSHKNKQWQPYAAAMAASYAKAILMKVGQGEEAPLGVGQSTQ
jgi:nucleoside phosphorylase